MYKALGIALVFLSLGILTYKKVEAKREHLINLKEFRKALLVLKNEMSFSIPEVPLLCEKVSSQTVGEISSVFKNIGKKLQKLFICSYFRNIYLLQYNALDF